MRILTAFLDADVSVASMSAKPTHNSHCTTSSFTILAGRMQSISPVSCPGQFPGLRPVSMIHGTSPRGRQEDEEISSGEIQSLLTLLPATLSLHKGLHI